VGTCGKSWRRGIVEEIEQQVQDYYGYLNELRLGASNKVPVKPDILTALETLEKFGMKIVDGGFYDQPAIIIELLEVARNSKEMMLRIQDQNNVMPQG